MSEALSPERLLQEWDAFKQLIEVRSFSTKLVNCHLNFSLSCCVCFKRGNQHDSGVRKPLKRCRTTSRARWRMQIGRTSSRPSIKPTGSSAGGMVLLPDSD